MVRDVEKRVTGNWSSAFVNDLAKERRRLSPSSGTVVVARMALRKVSSVLEADSLEIFSIPRSNFAYLDKLNTGLVSGRPFPRSRSFTAKQRNNIMRHYRAKSVVTQQQR